MPTVLVTGAANGLGAAFVEAYRTQPSTQVLAIDRLPIPKTHANIQPYTLDLTDETTVTSFAASITSQPVDLLIHSAGIRGLVPSHETTHPEDVAPCETLEVMDTATIRRTFELNSLATFTLLRALLPNLRLAREPKVVVMSSRMGSLGNNQLPNKDAGSAYAYRMSKAALNMLVRSLAVDVPDVAFVLCHPGRVETKLVKCREEGAISAEESVKGLLPLIEGWGTGDSGKYFDRFGEVIQW